MKNFIEELKWRGMLQDIMPGTEEKLAKGITTAYIGFDPTADSLGVGNMVQIMTLVHYQRCGHRPMALVGGATGMVGDPSGKSEERNLLDEEVIQHNLACQQKQLEKFLDFDCAPNRATIVNNHDWFREMGFLEFIRDVGKHITVNYMMAKDSVKRRLEGETGMSFTEFTYQLVQGYDFYYLWKNKGVDLQMGGSDQWGNIVTGTELIRRMDGGQAFGLTTPLIKKSDGTKFGKSESGNIWLDKNRTSAYQFYQFWLNAADEDVLNYSNIFSLKEREELQALALEHQKSPHLRLSQRILGEELTSRVHSKEEFASVLKVTDLLFGQNQSALDDISSNEWESVGKEIPSFQVNQDVFAKGIPIDELLSVHTSVLASKSEVRRAIQGNALSINKLKTAEVSTIISNDSLIHSRFLFVENGKKNKFLIEVK